MIKSVIHEDIVIDVLCLITELQIHGTKFAKLKVEISKDLIGEDFNIPFLSIERKIREKEIT